MTLCVLNIAYPLAPVGPNAVGGAEQVLSQLDSALVAAGHHSIVIACEGSTTSGILEPLPLPRGSWGADSQNQAASDCRDAIQHCIHRWSPDVLHFHGIDFHRYLPDIGPPALVTLHLPPKWYPPAIFSLGRPNTFLNCVSESQKRTSADPSAILTVIENGVPDLLFQSSYSNRDYAVCLGRVCPEKGYHLALDAARSADIPLLIAGHVFPYPEHQAYFETEIAPRLDVRRRFIGPVSLHQKRRLLSAARCLVIPSLAPETSSLVAMEALACGTPVVALRAGALPDIIDHGRSGFLVNHPEQLSSAIISSAHLNRRACREIATSRFRLSKMVQKYFELYQRLADIDRTQAACGGGQNGADPNPRNH